MTGQTPEPSFQPSEQDSGLTQGRPAWQTPPPPSYTPPAGAGAGASGGQAYAAPPPYPPQDQGYPSSDQTQTCLGRGASQGSQGYQGYQQSYPGYDQGFGAQPGQDAATPQWQGAAGNTPARNRTKAAGEKGFFGSLFDFSFNSFVTPKIIKVLYVLVTAWTALVALTILIIAFRTGGTAGGIFTLVVIEPLFILLTLGIYRVILEAFMVVFRIYEETKKIRENGENRG